MALSDEERARKKARLAELESRRKRKSPAADPVKATPAIEEESDLGAIDTIRGGLQSVQRGQLFTAGDEIVGAGRAALDYLAPSSWGEGAQSWGDKYRMYRDDERRNQEQFADANPTTAALFELGGAIAAPIKGPRGAREASALKFNKAGQYVPPSALQKAVRKATPAGGYRAAAGRGALEGAAYGVGSADEMSDVVDSAKSGLLTGGAFGAGFRGLQGLGQGIAKQRVAEDLGKGEDFKPLWLALEKGGLKDFYRNFLGRSFFARRAMQTQEEPFEALAQAGVTRAKTAKTVGMDALDKAAKAIDENFENTKKLINDETILKNSALKNQRDKLVKETAAALDDDVRNLRATAAQEAFPDNYRAQRLDGVDLDDPIAVSQRLDEFWRKDAFRMVKDRTFDWDTSLPSRLREEFNKDPGLIIEMADEPELINVLARKFGVDNEAVDEILKRFTDWAGDTGMARGDEIFLNPKVKIDGDALMEFRNFFAKRANKPGDKSRGYGLIRQRFDDMIEGQLDDIGLEAFKDEKTRYTTNLAYRSAVNKAKPTGGKFTPNQWLTAGSQYGDYSTRKVPLQRQADAVNSRGMEAKLADANDKVSRANKAKRLGQREKAAINRADRLKKSSKEALDTKRTKTRLSDAVAKARQEKSELAKKTISKDPSGLSEWLTTRMLSDVLVPGVATAALGPVGIPVGLAASAAVSRGFASQGGQRLMAGQSGMQNAMRNMSDNELQRMIAKMLRQGATRTSTMNTVD